MDDLNIDQIKQLLIFYKQKSADLEFELLKSQVKSIKPQGKNSKAKEAAEE